MGIAFPLCINSCSQISDAINEPVREYFENLSDGSQIVGFKIFVNNSGTLVPAPTAKDANGNTCVGSGSDIIVKLQLRNPNNFDFTLGSNFSYSLVDSATAALPGATGITIEQTSKTEMTLTYPSVFLTAAEYGKNISEHIEISHPSTGTSFPSFTLPLYCNSAPPAIVNAVTYTKTDASGNKTYVVCFSIAPLNPTTQNDLKYLKIGSTTIPISVFGSSITFTDSKLHQSNINSASSPGCTYLPNGQAFPVTVPYPSFYYETSDLVTTDKAYTISLIDEAGLTSSATTAANSYTIAATTLIDSAGTSHNGALAPATPAPTDEIKLGQDEDSSYAKVKIKVPTSATGPVTKSISGVTVDYTVTESAPPATPVFEGTTTSDYNLNLAPGTYTIVCTATKDGYTQSTTTFSVKVIPTKMYVSALTGDDTLGNGTKEYPYKTISFADSKFPLDSDTPSGAVKTIFVLDDLGSEQTDVTVFKTKCINCQNHTLTDVKLSIDTGCVVKNATIAGSNTYKKIVGADKVLENVTLARTGSDLIAVTGKTSLKNVNSTNNNAISANSIIIKGKVTDLTFMLGNSSVLTIEASMSGSSNNKIELTASPIIDAPSPGTPRVFTTGYGTYNTANPASYFTSDSYGIIKATVSGTEEAALAVSGGSISVYTPDGKLSLSATPTTIPATGDTDITISADGTLESGTTVTPTDEPTKFTDWDIKAYYEYDYRHASPTAAPTPAAVPAAATPLQLTFPAAYPAGSYVIVIFVTFNGTRYSCEMVVNKT
ncbi:MAG: hypothetical protein J6X67_10020 [Treponema sp.]|nr:hypothetical protein [Treponema sp.]